MSEGNECNYCQRCGCALIVREFEGASRPTCEACGFVVFIDPKIAAAALVSVCGKLLLIKRGTMPGIGKWSFPGGYVDRGERVEDAAQREVLEETGLRVEITGLIGLYSEEGDPVILAAYSGKMVGGEIAAGSDTQDARLFDADALPDLAFERDRRIISDWNSMQPGT